MPGGPQPVLFIHGLWLHSTAWDPWIEAFRNAGYAPSAPGWPGEQATVEDTRANPDSVAGFGVEEIVDHYAAIIAVLDAPPILIGHSLGGLIVEKLLGEGLAAAAVAIEPAPVKGVLPLSISALRTGFPVLKNPANRDRALTLTHEQFRYGFGNAITELECEALFDRWTIPSPGKPLFQTATANLHPHAATEVDTGNSARGPLLLIMGGQDHTVPETVVKSTLKQYRHSTAVTDLREFADRGHSLTVDSGWPEVADAILTWLKEQGL